MNTKSSLHPQNSRIISSHILIRALHLAYSLLLISYATVKRWYSEFIRGRYSLTDEFRKDRPKSVVRTENINVVQKLIMQDRHVT